MKKVLFTVAVLAFATSFTSCKKCGRCVYTDGVEGTEFCQKDSKVLYDAAKASCKDAGGSWE